MCRAPTANTTRKRTEACKHHRGERSAGRGGAGGRRAGRVQPPWAHSLGDPRPPAGRGRPGVPGFASPRGVPFRSQGQTQCSRRHAGAQPRLGDTPADWPTLATGLQKGVSLLDTDPRGWSEPRSLTWDSGDSPSPVRLGGSAHRGGARLLQPGAHLKGPRGGAGGQVRVWFPQDRVRVSGRGSEV